MIFIVEPSSRLFSWVLSVSLNPESGQPLTVRSLRQAARAKLTRSDIGAGGQAEPYVVNAANVITFV